MADHETRHESFLNNLPESYQIAIVRFETECGIAKCEHLGINPDLTIPISFLTIAELAFERKGTKAIRLLQKQLNRFLVTESGTYLPEDPSPN